MTTSIEQLKINNVGVWFVPVANPWARELVETNKSRACQRTNSRGVDLNRNFPSVYSDNNNNNEDEQDKYRKPHKEEYAGDFPLSERESVGLAEYLDYVSPHLLINVHSGARDILLPFDYTGDALPRYYHIMTKLANAARAQTCRNQCKLAQSSLLLYQSFGTLMDYGLLYRNVQLAYTLEIYASNRTYADDDDISEESLTPELCISYFNPPSGEELEATLRQWAQFILILLTKLLTIIE